MADWYGASRSNFFKVKDEAAFRAWVATCPGLGLWHESDKFALFGEDTDDGSWPCADTVCCGSTG